MKTLHSIADLSQYGIGILTGESCPFGMRILCDLTDRGRDLVAAFLGTPDLDCFTENWNVSVAGVPAVASVMLTRSALAELCIFALLYVDKMDVVMVKAGTVAGLHRDHEYYERYMVIVHEVGSGYTLYRRMPAHPQCSGRNLHAMTGRTL